MELNLEQWSDRTVPRIWLGNDALPFRGGMPPPSVVEIPVGYGLLPRTSGDRHATPRRSANRLGKGVPSHSRRPLRGKSMSIEPPPCGQGLVSRESATQWLSRAIASPGGQGLNRETTLSPAPCPPAQPIPSLHPPCRDPSARCLPFGALSTALVCLLGQRPYGADKS